MNQLVVLLALASTVCGSVVPALWAQPAHHPALVLDPHGRPLDTAEVISARALHLQAKSLEGHYAHVAPIAYNFVAAPAVVAAPAAVSHQSRVDVHSSPAVVTTHALASPLYGGAHFLSAHHGHLLKKRSLAHFAYSAPVYAAPAAVSHQSRVDVHSSPAVVPHAVHTPVLAAPVAYTAPAAVSHQSRVDVRSGPALLAPVHHAAVYHSSPLVHSTPYLHAW